MIKFLKENIIFVTSSILLTGLLIITSAPPQIPNSNQINTNQTLSTNTIDKVNPQVVLNNISQFVNTKTVTKKISKSIPSSTANTKIKQRLQNEERDD